MTNTYLTFPEAIYRLDGRFVTINDIRPGRAEYQPDSRTLIIEGWRDFGDLGGPPLTWEVGQDTFLHAWPEGRGTAIQFSEYAEYLGDWTTTYLDLQPLPLQGEGFTELDYNQLCDALRGSQVLVDGTWEPANVKAQPDEIRLEGGAEAPFVIPKDRFLGAVRRPDGSIWVYFNNLDIHPLGLYIIAPGFVPPWEKRRQQQQA